MRVSSYLQKIFFLGLFAAIVGCKKDGEQIIPSPDPEDYLLSIEVDPAFYPEGQEEWFYLASPEGELITEPVKAENGKTNHIKRPEGYIHNSFQLYSLKAAVGVNVNDFDILVYTDFEEKTIYKKTTTNSPKITSVSNKLHVLQEPYGMIEKEFYIASSFGILERLRSTYDDETGEVTGDFYLADQKDQNFFVFFDEWNRWESGFSYLELKKIEGQTIYTVQKDAFKKADKNFNLTLEGNVEDIVSFKFIGVKDGNSFHFPNSMRPGEPFSQYYLKEGFSDFNYSAYWTRENGTSFSLLGSGIPTQQLLKPKEYVSSVMVASVTDFTYNVIKEADVAITVKSFYQNTPETSNMIEQKIVSPGKQGSFKIASLPQSLIEIYPYLEQYPKIKHRYSDFNDYNNINSYSEFLKSIISPEEENQNFWIKYGGRNGQTIYNEKYYDDEGARKSLKQPELGSQDNPL